MQLLLCMALLLVLNIVVTPEKPMPQGMYFFRKNPSGPVFHTLQHGMTDTETVEKTESHKADEQAETMNIPAPVPRQTGLLEANLSLMMAE